MRHIFVLALLAACGGTQATPAGAPAKAEMHHEGGHAAMAPEMQQFHDVLAPRWHADKGPQRMTDTCAVVPQLTADADAIAKATPPESAHADTWTAGTRALVDAVAKLAASCKANDTTQFETAFSSVHDAFHSLMGMAGAEHDEGMEAMHHTM